MSGPDPTLLRALPAVGVLVEAWRRAGGADSDPKLAAFLARRLVDEERGRILRGESKESPDLERLLPRLDAAAARWAGSSSSRVVNGTGIVLHSGLGRALYPPRALAELNRTLAGYNLLEVDREEGARRKRDAFCEELLCELTGAEAALVVNNNAAATMIILSALAKDREVIVSRSQLIEIGGSYRLPDVFEASGCRLKEVGTTNKSYPRDYEGAIGEDTGALMLVHTSNYRIVGFTEHVGIAELVRIGRENDLPVIDDLGSGSLIDLAPYGVPDEPPVPASVKAGADVICFSGDKLIGGCQAGIIVGTKKWIERIRKNPMARALRIDKATCILLEATLKLYFEPERLFQEVPTLRMMREDVEVIGKRADHLAETIRNRLGERVNVEVVDSSSQLGAGTLPLIELPTRAVALVSDGINAAQLGRRLRMRQRPVFSRVRDERVHLDARTIQDGDAEHVAAALDDIFRGDHSS